MKIIYLILLFLTTFIYGQSTGYFEVTPKLDNYGSVLRGATVYIVNDVTGDSLLLTERTGKFRGTYYRASVTYGDWKVYVQKTGFNSGTQTLISKHEYFGLFSASELSVTKIGTPADNQIGVWTGDGTIEGDANLTWTGTKLNLHKIQIDGNNIFPHIVLNSGSSLSFGSPAATSVSLNTSSDEVTINATTTNMTGSLDLSSNTITSVADPSSAQDAATKNYVDGFFSNVDTLAADADSAYIYVTGTGWKSWPINNSDGP